MPSDLHELRVKTLDSLAFLAGCSSVISLGVGQIPDVAKANHRSKLVFVGEAKDTEAPGCHETFVRLGRYCWALSGWRSDGYKVRVAVCHHRSDAHEWAGLIRRAFSQAGLRAGEQGRVMLDERDSITWIEAIN